MLLSACLVSAGVLVVAWLWGVIRRVERLLEAGAHLRPDEALTALVAVLALLVTAWLSLAVVVELLARVPGRVGRAARAVATAVTPVLVRRTLALLLGAGVAAGLGQGGASAASVGIVVPQATPDPGPGARPLPEPGWLLAPPAPHPTDPPSPHQQGSRAPRAATAPNTSTAPHAGWVPTAPTTRPQPDVRVLSPAPRSRADDHDTTVEVVVRRGDSLWSIAARHLGPDPSEAEIAEAWPTWYAANREVIGPDPDLLLPGQVLRAPEVVRP
jgi:hypothetical protein